MSNQDENDAISALTGFSINHVLGDLALPVGDGLSNQLGISGIPALNSTQIYSEKWDEDAVGPEQGEDWEDEIDREMREEDASDGMSIKQEVHSPGVRQKQRRTRVVKRLVERPKSVYERFPAFEKDKVLDFSELFKGYAVRKSRLSKRPYQGQSDFASITPCLILTPRQWRLYTLAKRRTTKVSWTLLLVMQGDRWRINGLRRWFHPGMLKRI